MCTLSALAHATRRIASVHMSECNVGALCAVISENVRAASVRFRRSATHTRVRRHFATRLRLDCARRVKGNRVMMRYRANVTRVMLAKFCYNRYLVDPASGHMLVSKIKPCMSEHEPN